MESASAKYKISKFEISVKIQFYPPKRPLQDAFSAQNTILSAQKAPAGRPSVIPIAKYTTLGPKFYAKLDSAITQRRSKLW